MSTQILQHIIDDYGNAIQVYALHYEAYMVRYGYFKGDWEI